MPDLRLASIIPDNPPPHAAPAAHPARRGPPPLFMPELKDKALQAAFPQCGGAAEGAEGSTDDADEDALASLAGSDPVNDLLSSLDDDS